MGETTSKLFVVSGPSGAGKGTLVARVRAELPDLGLTVSATTRSPRAGEVDGTSYYFLTPDEFQRHVDAGEFLKWAHVYGNCYGTLKSEVERTLSAGSSLILEIDVQGALQVRERMPEAVLIFIKPPSLEVPAERMRGRGTEIDDLLALRRATAEREFALIDRDDEVVVNDDLDEAVDALIGIIKNHERS